MENIFWNSLSKIIYNWLFPAAQLESPAIQPLPSPPRPPHPRTFRLSLIPTSINQALFRDFLENLGQKPEDSTENILAYSLAPHINWLVATVAFREEPLDFAECRPNCELHIPLPSELGGDTITVDCDFYGMTPLYHPPSKPKYDVVAVSGISSHAYGSWKSPRRSYVMWLRDFLPRDFPDFRIFVWGLESNLRDFAATSTIEGFSRQLLTSVEVVREDENASHRPIIFVGHSLGGLIIKRALVEAAQGNSAKDRAILNSCVGIFLFGVPNQGLNDNNLLLLTKGHQNAPFVANLMENSELLYRLNINFRRSYEIHLKYCFVVSFYEMRDTMTVEATQTGEWKRTGKHKRMVTRDSATGFMPSEEIHNQIGIVLDHSTIVKFTSRADHNYLTVRGKMKEMLEEVPLILIMRKCF